MRRGYIREFPFQCFTDCVYDFVSSFSFLLQRKTQYIKISGMNFSALMNNAPQKTPMTG